MSEKVQGTWPDDYRMYGPGLGMQEYLRDGEIDARRAAFEAADRLADLLRGIMDWVGTPMPTADDVEAAIRAYEDAKAKVRP